MAKFKQKSFTITIFCSLALVYACAPKDAHINFNAIYLDSSEEGAQALSSKSTRNEETLSPSPKGCYLFENKSFDPSYINYEVSNYHVKNEVCTFDNGKQERISIREFKIKDKFYQLLVNPKTLETEILKQTCLNCVPTNLLTYPSHYAEALVRYTSNASQMVDTGFIKSEHPLSGSVLTADLCPSHEPFDKEMVEQVILWQTPAPIAFAVSGRWLKKYQTDFQWIKEHMEQGKLNVVWVNHSYTHPYKHNVVLKDNFLLSPHVDMEKEVLETEVLMIQMGVTPSVFFRFPGLYSNEKLILIVRDYGLIPLGTESWLAEGQKPKDGSIILIHANGNEPAGIHLLYKYQKEQKLPLPLRSLLNAIDEPDVE